MGWLGDHVWAIWLVLALVLGVAEMMSLDLVLLMLAVGALGGSLTAVIGAPVVVQLVVAGVLSAGMLGLVRPNLVRRLHSGPDLKLGHHKLIGERATVTTEVSSLVPGQVRLAGETWTAQPYDETLTIPVGETVEVFAIKGATAYVHPVGRLEP